MKRKIILISILSLALIGCNSNESELKFYGNVDIRQVSLAFENSERLASVSVEEGDVVTKGQVLATLESKTLRLQIEQAEAKLAASEQALLRLKNGTRPEEIEQAKAQLESAEAEVELANQNLSRMEKLSSGTAGRGVSIQDLDNAKAVHKVAQAKRKEAEKALELAEIGPRVEDIARAEAEVNVSKTAIALLKHQLELTELKAPQSGTVRARLLEVGDMASPQRPVYSIAITDPKWVRIYVNEVNLGRIKEGQKADVVIDSQPDKKIPGQIGYIAEVAEFTPKNVQTEDLRTSLVYEVRVLVHDTENVLRLGMPATVYIRD